MRSLEGAREVGMGKEIIFGSWAYIFVTLSNFIWANTAEPRQIEVCYLHSNFYTRLPHFSQLLLLALLSFCYVLVIVSFL